MDRKSFQQLSGYDNPQFMEDGKAIYAMMVSKYGTGSVEDLDNIMNGISCALVLLVNERVAKDERRYILQIINKILRQNIRE